ncbi:MAG: hypothetical protein WDM89_00145 [Rhizomicrobium sp.]
MSNGNRKGAGAPRGNRNAQTHGCRSATFVARRRAARDLIRASKEMAKWMSVMVDAGVDPNAHPELFEALAAQSHLSLRKLEDTRIAKELTNDQNFPDESTKSAAYRETRDEIHLVQPDAVAVPAGRLPGEEPFGVGGHRFVAVRSGEEPRGLQHLYGPSGICRNLGLRRHRRERAITRNGYGIMPSPNIIAAGLARRTKDVGLVVLGNSIALYNPPVRVGGGGSRCSIAFRAGGWSRAFLSARRWTRTSAMARSRR